MKQDVESRIAAIELRNKKVELDKAWEVSWTRRIVISLLTYIVVASYLLSIGNDKPFVNAIVPVVGFLLSTLLLPWFKSVWQDRHE